MARDEVLQKLVDLGILNPPESEFLNVHYTKN